MKKFLSLAMIIVLLTSLLSGCGESGVNSDGTLSENTEKNQLVVGNSSELNGNFFTNFWGNNDADLQVKNLIHGTLGTVVYKKDTMGFDYNQHILKNVTELNNDDGTKTFTFELTSDMKYSDGSSIKASDYVFAILFGSNGVIKDAGASEPSTGFYYSGYPEYRDGSKKEFSGIRLLDEYSFSVQVSAENLPFFYDLAYVEVVPYPMAVIAPGCTIKDDGNGAYIDGPFNSELLAETVTNPETGYLYAPTVVAGPYMLESFDEASKVAVLKINPNYYGNYEGQKPSIERIVIKSTQEATQIDELASGNIDLLLGVGGGDYINAGLDLVDEGKASYVSYPRAGFGNISFHCDFGATQFTPVRQAISYLIDVPEFARIYTGGYASVVYGWYGSAQWMAKENASKIKSEFNTYDLSLDKAKELLIADGWTLNKDGNEFNENSDTLRYKMVDGVLMPLEIFWARESGNPVSDLIAQMLPDNMSKVGMKLTSETLDFPVILDNFYGNVTDKDGNRIRKYNMYNLAANFNPIFEPKYTFSKNEEFLGNYNSTFIKDDELSSLAGELNLTPSNDRTTYSQKWYALQKRFNELVPVIPLYSDEYHDFFTPRLKGFETDSFWDFESAILYAWLED